MPAKLPSYSNPDSNAVAILGISISAPANDAHGLDAETCYEFRKSVSINTVPSVCCNVVAHHDITPAKAHTKTRFPRGLYNQDLQELGVTPMEYPHVPVMEVILLTRIFGALEHSGVEYRGTRTGVYVECIRGNMILEMDITQAGACCTTGVWLSNAVNHIKCALDLLGPSFTLDTAFSPRQSATQLAVEAIADGQCSQAVVASIASTLSSIDEVNGSVHGNAVSAVVLKRHDLAVKDRDNIYATYTGISLTSFESIAGPLTTPSPKAFGTGIRHPIEHERRPEHPDIHILKDGPFLFAIGALSLKAVNTSERFHKDRCAEHTALTLSARLGNRARQMPWRTYAVADCLQSAAFPDPVAVEKRPNPLVFCFSGQGPHHWQQGRDFMATYSVFRESIHACDKAYFAYTGNSFLQETGLFVADPPTSSPLAESSTWPAAIISVSMTFFQIAMFDLLTSLGIKPDAIVGPSIGVTAAMYASGAMPREMVIEIAISRGRALAMVDNMGGAMFAVSGCNVDRIRGYADTVASLNKLRKEESSKLYVAAPLSPTDTVFSGSEVLVNLLTKYIDTYVDGVIARKLPVTTGVHSPFVDACEDAYRSELSRIFSRYAGPFIPSIPDMSMVTAEFQSCGYTVDYLWDNLQQPMLFLPAIIGLLNKCGERTTFIEVSPHPVHSLWIKKAGAFDSLATATRPPSARHLIPGAKRHRETEAFLQTIGQLLLYGVNSINFSVLNGCPSEPLDGPFHPFGKIFDSCHGLEGLVPSSC
ncbi:FabD/lysophospholipase-like protein [Laetiporus sulphureus 93-53]|uniref:FabD/lysophospholipase-like protein n=1 Tax=Laetiporus sulphureus 93-53 TaxID=1314785 RepID=A0A165CNU6_9APHY|nr:FabD/lysophospholipase-like protein [Laetiporus sulphureus 93-53]KZT03147.1 FabD/lysophospholipase-like protein [Laetiporus sulphureus 93-53]